MKMQKYFSLHYAFAVFCYIATPVINSAHAKHKPHESKMAAVHDLKTTADYKKMLSHEEPSIIMLHAEWCGACKSFMPTFKKVAEKYQKNGHFYLLNEATKELEKEIAAFNVKGFPTIVYIKKDLGGAPENIFDIKVRDFFNIPDEPIEKPVAKKEVPKAAESKTASHVKEIKSKKEFDAIMHGKKPALVLLHASWCTACTLFKPTYHDVAKKYADQVDFYMLDVDTKGLEKDVESFNIEGIPTTVIYRKEGKKLVKDSTMVGSRPAEFVEAKINDLLKGKKAAVPAKKEQPKSKKKKNK